jgi:dihydrofolate reductase
MMSLGSNIDLRSMAVQRELILYIAQSLDGFIAPPDEDLSFLSIVAVEGEDYGYADFVASCDTVIMGRRTYDKVASMGVPDPHPGRTLYVITRTLKPSQGEIHFRGGDVVDLVRSLKAQAGKHIYCDGGAQLIHILLQHDLIDRYIISTVPVLLGGGIRLFQEGRAMRKLELVESRRFASGLVKSEYRRVG